jgi:hypothetical protein
MDDLRQPQQSRLLRPYFKMIESNEQRPST